jgi:hypothetical protein
LPDSRGTNNGIKSVMHLKAILPPFDGKEENKLNATIMVY